MGLLFEPVTAHDIGAALRQHFSNRAPDAA
jgi:hypothetical protein